ncbi:glycosyltransferase [candidate division GN15 bacterium]|nr:glycosyltransferase [candidate division GN15 bacterium]
MNSRTHKTLILIPAYNAADHLPELLKRVMQVVPSEDVLVVNDGSTDRTVDCLRESKVTFISFPENRGKGAALRAGYAYAVDNDYRSVLSLDADLQHLPEEIPAFLEADNGGRVIIGTRRIEKALMPPHRLMTNNLTSLIISIFSRTRIRDSQSGFRLVPTRLLRQVRLGADMYDLESELLFKAGALRWEVVEVPVSTVYGEEASHIHKVRDTLRFIRQIWRRIWV